MGSSTRKKKEKQKDFQKPKLKVGKAKAKPANFTDTSFRSKSIVVNQQSLSENAPDVATQFRHHLSLATTSRSDSQRRDSLAHLTSHLSLASLSGGGGGGGSAAAAATTSGDAVSTMDILNRVLPLLCDPAAPVRTQLLKLLHLLPAADVRPATSKILLYVRAGITHLSAAVRDDALGVLEWLLDVAGDELVACPGGWLKTLNGFGAMMGWAALGEAGTGGTSTSGGWTTAPKVSFASAISGGSGSGSGTSGGGSKSKAGGGNGNSTASLRYARQISALAKFLDIGLRQELPAAYDPQGFWNSLYRMPTGASSAAGPFDHLNLFGAPRDEDSEMYADREDRQRVFVKRWQAGIVRGIDEARKEGGAVGRAAATLDEAVRKGMVDYEADDSW